MQETQTVTQSGPVWGEFAVPMSPEAATETLANVARALSKQGKLPGYRPGSRERADVVTFHGFGEPWDFEVSAKVEAAKSAEAKPAECSRVWFQGRVLPKSPTIFALVSIVSVWPGVWLTDSMLKVYFKSYTWNTYLWYIPLTVLPLPWMAWRMWTRSNRSAREHAAEKIPLLRDAMMAAKHA